MENYLVDNETLTNFVDELIAKKFPDESPENHQTLRAESIDKLGNAINDAVFSNLDEEKIDELDALLDQEDATENTFTEYLASNGIDLEKTLMQVFEDFRDAFLGGDNE